MLGPKSMRLQRVNENSVRNNTNKRTKSETYPNSEGYPIFNVVGLSQIVPMVRTVSKNYNKRHRFARRTGYGIDL